MTTATGFGVGLVTDVLEQAGVSHEVVENAPTYCASEEAAAAHAEMRFTAKTLVLHDRGGLSVAVLPADRRLDLEKARRLLGGMPHLRLAPPAQREVELP